MIIEKDNNYLSIELRQKIKNRRIKSKIYRRIEKIISQVQSSSYLFLNGIFYLLCPW